MRDAPAVSVQALTGRTVLAGMSDHHVDPDLAVEIFVLGSAETGGEAGAAESSARAGDVSPLSITHQREVALMVLTEQHIAVCAVTSSQPNRTQTKPGDAAPGLDLVSRITQRCRDRALLRSR
jgi:hypothetical protein